MVVGPFSGKEEVKSAKRSRRKRKELCKMCTCFFLLALRHVQESLYSCSLFLGQDDGGNNQRKIPEAVQLCRNPSIFSQAPAPSLVCWPWVPLCQWDSFPRYEG